MALDFEEAKERFEEKDMTVKEYTTLHPEVLEEIRKENEEEERAMGTKEDPTAKHFYKYDPELAEMIREQNSLLGDKIGAEMFHSLGVPSWATEFEVRRYEAAYNKYWILEEQTNARYERDRKMGIIPPVEEYVKERKEEMEKEEKKCFGGEND